MKRISVLLISSVIMLSSCTEFLTLEPQDELIREEYWKTEGDVVAVLGTTYARLSSVLDEIYYWSELRGGLISPDEKRVSENSLEFYNYNINEYNSRTRWDDFYVVINLANTLLKYAPLAEENDDTFSPANLRGYLAEAYFIRSLCYFYLVKAYRDVPLITEPYATDGQDFSIEKTNESVIIDTIVSNLNMVANYAFEASHFETIEEQKGRVSRNAINALLADVYLWNNQFTECLDACNSISDVYLVDGQDYFSLYSGDGNSLESIFELQFDYNEYETTNSLYYLTSNNSRGNRENIVSEFLMGLYNLEDLREYYDDETFVTYNPSSLSLWKYEGNAPYHENSQIINRTYEESDANFIFYRLAEIHLMKAEAYAESGNLGAAVEELNIIKDRAGIELYTDDTDFDKLIKEILDERARELVGEGKRWFDLVRVARRDINDRLGFISDAVISNVDPRSRTAAATKIKDVDSWFLPVYFEELILNKKLEQNPFYE